MNQRLKILVCATIVATQWGFVAVSAHGRGSGGILDPLQSQGSLVLSQDGLFLFAANAGSGTISSFRVRPYGLDFVGEVHSGGEGPISIATLLGTISDGLTANSGLQRLAAH
jgi:hypothetical protein